MPQPLPPHHVKPGRIPPSSPRALSDPLLRVLQWLHWLLLRVMIVTVTMGQPLIAAALDPAVRLIGEEGLLAGLITVIAGVGSFAVVSLLASLRSDRTKAVLARGGCGACGYDLRGLPSDEPCPNCGHRHPLEKLAQARRADPESSGAEVESELIDLLSPASPLRSAWSVLLGLGTMMLLVGIWMFTGGWLRVTLLLVWPGLAGSAVWFIARPINRIHGRMSSLRCWRCGYNLRGSTPELGCPECGATHSRRILSIADEKLAQQYRMPPRA